MRGIVRSVRSTTDIFTSSIAFSHPLRILLDRTLLLSPSLIRTSGSRGGGRSAEIGNAEADAAAGSAEDRAGAMPFVPRLDNIAGASKMVPFRGESRDALAMAPLAAGVERGPGSSSSSSKDTTTSLRTVKRELGDPKLSPTNTCPHII